MNRLKENENQIYEAMLEDAWERARKIYGKGFYKTPGQFRLRKETDSQYLEWSPGYDCSGMG